ncbi:hypothetical protein ACHAWF_015990 [Thalassiosira exigua]
MGMKALFSTILLCLMIFICATFNLYLRLVASTPLPHTSGSNASNNSAHTYLFETNNCSQQLKLYIYEPISEKLLADPKYPIGNKSVLVRQLGDYMFEAALLGAFQHKDRNCIITQDPNKANAFLVPHAIAAHFYNVPNANRLLLEDYYRETLRPFLQHIQQDLPYFNESLKASNSSISINHFFINTFDNGPFCDENTHVNEINVFQDQVWKDVVAPMMQIGYYSQLEQVIPKERSASRRTLCFIPDKDIAAPMYDEESRNSIQKLALFMQGCNLNNADAHCLQQWKSYLHKRAMRVSRPFYFQGSIWGGKRCAAGIRPFLQSYCQQEPENCHFQNISCRMDDSIFAFCPAGWACWSARFYDAWDHMTIPVRFSEDMAEPFASAVPQYSKMMISIRTTETPHIFQGLNLSNSRATSTATHLVNGTEFLNELASLAREWVHVCAATNTTHFDNDCVTHTVSKRLWAIAQNRHLFSWAHVNAAEGAYSMLEQEMWNRVRRNLLK